MSTHRPSPPRVSVIIPTYNRKALVQQAIDSVLSQTYPNYEILVVDDGSRDGTREALVSRYGDRISYHWQENQGESVARNVGISMAQGEYVGFLDDDDVYLPRMLQVAIDFLDHTPDVGMLSVQSLMITESGEILENVGVDRDTDGLVDAEELLLKTVVLPSNSIVRRATLATSGVFDTSVRYGEDGDLNRRIFACTRIYYLAEPLVALRASDNKQSGHILDPDKAWHRYSDLKVTLSKIDNHPLFQAQMPRLWAQVKARFALNLLAHDDVQRGEALLSEVCELDSSDWFFTNIMRDLVLPYIEAIDDERGIEDATRYADCIFRIVASSNAFDPKWKRVLLGEFHFKRFFRRASRQDWSGMRYSYVRAIAYDPTCVKNRGMHSFYVRSFLPRR